ncbi:MAG TPA: hypothetical protein VME70_04535 [Mycobacteriales bacterium]|nr:hypothetical protein [Mycobacteriales bacterium]
MTSTPASASGDPQNLLAATRSLTRRVRRDQRSAWLPLLVFAVVTFGAIPFDRYGPHHTHCAAESGGREICRAYGVLSLWYWTVALLLAYAVIGWFYLRRSNERGIGTRVQPYLAVGAALTVLTIAWALWSSANPTSLHAISNPGSPGTLVDRIASPEGAIGLALLLLAWIERDWVLAAVTVVYLVVAMTVVHHTRLAAHSASLLTHLAHPDIWGFLPRLLASGAVLLAGSLVVALAHARRQRPAG